MLTSWTLQNFKSVYDETTLEIAPLTIFAGANSSGKSTLIQSLLLTAQTIQSPVRDRPVVLNGHILKLGSFEDVLSNGASRRSVSVGFDIKPVHLLQSGPVPGTGARNFYYRHSENLESLSVWYSFTARGDGTDKEVSLLHPKLVEAGVRVDLSGQAGPTSTEFSIMRSLLPLEERLAQLHLTKEQLTRPDIAALAFETIKPSENNFYRPTRQFVPVSGGRPVGAVVQHFLPHRILAVFDEVAERAKGLVSGLMTPDTYRYVNRDFYIKGSESITPGFLNEVRALIEAFLEELAEEQAPRRIGISRPAVDRARRMLSDLLDDFGYEQIYQTLLELPGFAKRQLSEVFAEKHNTLVNLAKVQAQESFQVTYFLPNDEIDAGLDIVQMYFGRFLKYLGPLRDEPKPVYPLSGPTDPRDVGFKGEFTAAVLDVHRDTLVDFINPEHFVEGYAEAPATRLTLYRAVLEWLKYMGVANAVSTTDRGKLGHELKVRPSGGNVLHDLTHVGVGVSQVLPILVMSLLAEPGTTLIFEQPELHLHPKVQSRLADFFVSMTLMNKQCVVETHSEYLINRLRYQTAIASDEFVSRNIVMYFVEKESNQSRYRAVRINRFGVIDEWPKGFFDEGDELAASVLKASVNKKKRQDSSDS